MKTVLIVDDSRMSRMMVTAIVKKEHPEWAIIEAEHGDDAISKAEGTDIDMMILDYNMPGMSGEELASKLRDIYPDARMTLLTANLQVALKERLVGINVGHISKPIKEENIIAYINK